MIRRIWPIAMMLIACVLTAEGLSAKYRSWDKSPDAYFMTAEERLQWAQLKNDDEASKFVAAYFARRSPGLPAMLKEREAVADKYFSSGSLKGSQTLRGKVIIVFGPPSAIKLSNPHMAGTAAGDGEVVYAGGGNTSPLNNVGPGAAGLNVSASEERTFTVTYDEKAAPKAIGKAFHIDLRMKSDERQEPADKQDLDAKFETVAASTITK